MHRRDLLRTAARSAAALAFLPRTAAAETIWQRVADLAAPAHQGTLVIALADTLLPRTDTPGANDVNVSAFVDVIVSEYYSADERAEYEAGLQAIDALARQMAGAPFAALTEAQRIPVMNALEEPADPSALAARTYLRLKRLIVHGYFTSERVQREVLEVEIFPGRFDGAAPMRVRTRSGEDAQ